MSAVSNISKSRDGMHGHHASRAKASEELHEAAWVIVTRSTLDSSWVRFGISFGHSVKKPFTWPFSPPVLTFIHMTNMGTFIKL